ncbi:phage terminase small subunit [Romboutsia sp. 1001713B170131_170501_G6]|uniref:phage terminase small subunit n=1 Tax=Romboutsia sp. 1001713B170131_170501_G6 TaxID=2787108 RepID=UPI0018AB1359|nr:phage terminase small subunit [Romboutsia sp. 1001713B170131_170501_G6]
MEGVKENIKKDYIEGLKQKEICEKYDISINTLKSWIKRYKWAEEKRNKGAPINKKGAPISNIKNEKKSSDKPKSRLTKDSYPLQARPGNKNAVTTGEFETIFFDTLEDDELELVDNTPFEKMKLLKQEIQLLTVRERRMLKRIDKLKEANEVVIDTETHGTQGDSEVSLVNYESTLNKIQNIEEALTRVQDKKQKAIESLHKFEIDEQKLELTVMKLELEIMKQGGQDEEVEDDGFMDALKSEVGDTWDD